MHRDYEQFDLAIQSLGEFYSARVLDSPAGAASCEFKLPFSDREVETFVLRLGRSERTARNLHSAHRAAAQSFGGALFAAVFAGEVLRCFRASVDHADWRGAGLRIRLRLMDVPQLADLPWEFLYDGARDRFLCLSAETPIVRYLELPKRIEPLQVEPPLEVLTVIANPAGSPLLDVEREERNLQGALDALVQRGLVVLDRLDPPTLAGLRHRLRQRPCHILHFIGHGGFDRTIEDGVLLFEDEHRQSHLVGSTYLGTLLHDHRFLRLIVLNACEGARGLRTDPFSGMAQGLVHQGIPAVLAMQFEISDGAALLLSEEFYRSIADGYPVDAALAESRKAIFTSGNDLEWGTPVLFLRAPDGCIFDIQAVEERGQPAVAPAQSPEPVAPGAPEDGDGIPALRLRLEREVTQIRELDERAREAWEKWIGSANQLSELSIRGIEKLPWSWFRSTRIQRFAAHFLELQPLADATIDAHAEVAAVESNFLDRVRDFVDRDYGADLKAERRAGLMATRAILQEMLDGASGAARLFDRKGIQMFFRDLTPLLTSELLKRQDGLDILAAKNKFVFCMEQVEETLMAAVANRRALLYRYDAALAP